MEATSFIEGYFKMLEDAGLKLRHKHWPGFLWYIKFNEVVYNLYLQIRIPMDPGKDKEDRSLVEQVEGFPTA